jgi:hypothetical protein
MISLIFSIVFFLLFIFFCITGGNYLLKSMIDNVLSNQEHFNNNENEIESAINPTDDCSKIDIDIQNNLNFQTATNIPLSPYYYKNYVGDLYIDTNIKEKNELTDGKYCLKKGKLLYDGIWDSTISSDNPYEFEQWNMTNGNVTDGYYCSNKLVEVNKPFPKNYIDKSATPPIINGKYYTYFNDTQDDVFDTEISCFPSIFNAGITEDLKKKYKDL